VDACTSEGTDKNIKVMIEKARTSFNMLKKIWNAIKIFKSTGIRILNFNVNTALFYGAETWKTSVASGIKIKSFINRYLRRISIICWSNCITNNDILQETKQLPPTIRRREWI
jgi:hypothetical protein